MPRFVIANRHPLSQRAAVVRTAGLREQAVVTDLLLRANRAYRKVLPVRLHDSYMSDLRAWRFGRQYLALHNAPFQEVARKLYLTMGFQRCPQYDFDLGDLPSPALHGERLAIDAFCLNLKR